MLQRDREQLFEIRHPESRHRIPSLGRVPARVRDDAAADDGRSGLAVDAIAADALTAGDVCEAGEAD